MATRQNDRSPASLSRLLLVGLWLAALSGMVGQRLRDLSAAELLGGIGLAASLLYIPVLIWHLIQQRPAAACGRLGSADPRNGSRPGAQFDPGVAWAGFRHEHAQCPTLWGATGPALCETRPGACHWLSLRG